MRRWIYNSFITDQLTGQIFIIYFKIKMSKCQHGQKITTFCASQCCVWKQAGGCSNCIKKYHNHMGPTIFISQQEAQQLIKKFNVDPSTKPKCRSLQQAIFNYFNLIKTEFVSFIDNACMDIINQIGHPFLTHNNLLTTYKRIKKKDYKKIQQKEFRQFYEESQKIQDSDLIENEEKIYIEKVKRKTQFINSLQKLIKGIQKMNSQFQQKYLPVHDASINQKINEIVKIVLKGKAENNPTSPSVSGTGTGSGYSNFSSTTMTQSDRFQIKAPKQLRLAQKLQKVQIQKTGQNFQDLYSSLKSSIPKKQQWAQYQPFTRQKNKQKQQNQKQKQKQKEKQKQKQKVKLPQKEKEKERQQYEKQKQRQAIKQKQALKILEQQRRKNRINSIDKHFAKVNNLQRHKPSLDINLNLKLTPQHDQPDPSRHQRGQRKKEEDKKLKQIQKDKEKQRQKEKEKEKQKQKQKQKQRQKQKEESSPKRKAFESKEIEINEKKQKLIDMMKQKQQFGSPSRQLRVPDLRVSTEWGNKESSQKLSQNQSSSSFDHKQDKLNLFAHTILPRTESRQKLFDQSQTLGQKTIIVPVENVMEANKVQQCVSPLIKSKFRSKQYQKNSPNKLKDSSKQLIIVSPTKKNKDEQVELSQKQQKSIALLIKSLSVKAEEAIPYLQSAFSYSDDNLSAAEYLSYLYLQLDKPKQCLTICNKVLQKLSNSSMNNQLSWHLNINKSAALNKLGRYSQSIMILQESLKHKQHAKLFKNLGDAYFSIGIFQKSNYYYQKAVGLDDNYDEAHYNLAVCLFVQQNYHNAKFSIVKALHYSPRNQNYLELQKQINLRIKDF